MSSSGLAFGVYGPSFHRYISMLNIFDKTERFRRKHSMKTYCSCIGLLRTRNTILHTNAHFLFFFSSPELKAQVSFSDHLSSVVCPSVCLSVCLSVNFSHFHLLLQNHWANFNQTWPKASLGEGIQVCSNEGPRPFPRGDNYEIAKIHWQN